MNSPTDIGTSVTGPLILLLILVVLGPGLLAAQDRKAIPNHGQIQTATFKRVRAGFAQPDMIYAPSCFWFWDEPLDPGKYPEKAWAMAREMLK